MTWRQPDRLSAALAPFEARPLSDQPGHLQLLLAGAEVDLLAMGFDKLPATGGSFLVGFSGAISDVASKEPPYFAGAGLALELGVPLLSFSDPVLSRSPTLSLGFHAGDTRLADLPRAIARVINAVTWAYAAQAVLFGGSGGGFGALNTLRYCRAQDTALVWNPQTELAKYHWPAVPSYVRTAFPGLMERHGITGEDQAAALTAALQAEGCPASLLPWGTGRKVLYCQNQGDPFHIKHHLAPFLRGSTSERLQGNAFWFPDRGTALYCGDWGPGHAPLPRPAVLAFLKGLLAGQAPADLASDYAKGQAATEGRLFFGKGRAGSNLGVSVSRDRDGQVHVRASLKDRVGTKHVTFAFYVMVGPDRQEVQWHRAKPTFSFTPGGRPDLSIRVFARDVFGNKLTRTVPFPPDII